MKNAILMVLAGLISFATAPAALAESNSELAARILEVSQDVRASELTRAACADRQGMKTVRAQMEQKIQALQEEEKAIILRMEAAPEDGNFSFQKKNLKGHANCKAYEGLMLGQRLIFVDQAISRCQ